MYQEKYRGRSPGLKCRVCRSPSVEHVQVNCPDELVSKPEWFAGNPDIDDKEDNDSHNDKQDKHLCGRGVEVQAKNIDPDHSHAGLQTYPPYLKVNGPGRMLVKGSTCQFIMQLHEQGLEPSNIAGRIANTVGGVYKSAEIDDIIRFCAMSDLTGQTPLAAESWENEPIEGWWYNEESYCEALRRQVPVGQDICGYDCDDGWWKDRQHEGNRDWVRFGDKSIGSESQRRRL